MVDNAGKAWWKSRTVLGAAAVLVGLIIRAVKPEADVSDDDILGVLSGLMQVVGAILAILGRITAKQQINRTISGKPRLPQ